LAGELAQAPSKFQPLPAPPSFVECSRAGRVLSSANAVPALSDIQPIDREPPPAITRRPEGDAGFWRASRVGISASKAQ
jgi:hypothetical protein